MIKEGSIRIKNFIIRALNKIYSNESNLQTAT